jgi:hypothetical protein
VEGPDAIAASAEAARELDRAAGVAFAAGLGRREWGRTRVRIEWVRIKRENALMKEMTADTYSLWKAVYEETLLSIIRSQYASGFRQSTHVWESHHGMATLRDGCPAEWTCVARSVADQAAAAFDHDISTIHVTRE